MLRGLNVSRDQAARCMQGMWRTRVARIANSKTVFERLGRVGQRRGRKTDKTAGLQASGYSFLVVRRRVTFLQRALRKWILHKVVAEMRTAKPHPYNFYIVRRAVKVIQRNWWGQHLTAPEATRTPTPTPTSLLLGSWVPCVPRLAS